MTRVLLAGGGHAHIEVLRRFALRRGDRATLAQAQAATRRAGADRDGDRHSIASRGPIVAEGDWVGRCKERLGRAFVAKYELPVDASSLAGNA